MTARRTVSLAVPFAVAGVALAGCAGASSTVAGAGAAVTPAHSASGPRPAAGPVYFAEGGQANGPVGYRPPCPAGCQLSGDGTTALWDMTWSTWTASEAAGTGTEKIDDCDPDCAQGTLHAVAVAVTFTRPVSAGCGAGARRYWTRAAFTWPHGLPPVLSGANAPANPFSYPGIGGAGSCR